MTEKSRENVIRNEEKIKTLYDWRNNVNRKIEKLENWHRVESFGILLTIIGLVYQITIG